MADPKTVFEDSTFRLERENGLANHPHVPSQTIQYYRYVLYRKPHTELIAISVGHPPLNRDDRPYTIGVVNSTKHGRLIHFERIFELIRADVRKERPKADIVSLEPSHNWKIFIDASMAWRKKRADSRFRILLSGKNLQPHENAPYRKRNSKHYILRNHSPSMKIVLFGLFVLVVLAGCTTGDTVQETLSQLPEAQTFLENNPDAVVTQSFLEGSEVANFLSKLREDCGDFPLAAAWEVVYRSAEQEMIVYLNGEGNTITCIVRPGELEGNECRIDQECDDGRDITTDACTGSPRKCIHAYRLCREVNGKECAATETCSENALKAADTEACCLAECIGEDPCADISCEEGFVCVDGECENTDTSVCANVNCASDQVCVNGLCEQQSCEQLQGDLCVGNFYCAGQAHNSSETAVCCIESCTEETCSHLGGQVCETGETCIGNIEQVQDTLVCCVGNCVLS